MANKQLALISFTCLLLAAIAAGDTPNSILRIESAVYDFRITDQRYDGFCMLTIRSYTPLKELRFSSDSDIELLDDGLGLDAIDGEQRITGFTPSETQTKVIMRLRGKLENNSELPLLRLHYKVDNTMIAVTAPKKSIYWNASFGTYGLEAEKKDYVIASDDYREEDTPNLNSEYLELRSKTTKSLSMPEYRLYLGGIDAGQKPKISPVIREVNDTLPQMLAIGLVSLGVIIAAWVLLKKKPQGRPEGPQVEPLEQAKDNWEEQKKAYELVLNRLQGDEQIVYKHLIDARGEMLQKNISEITGYGAVKTTRVLHRLEQKRLIERKSYGVTNKVVLRRSYVGNEASTN